MCERARIEINSNLKRLNHLVAENGNFISLNCIGQRPVCVVYRFWLGSCLKDYGLYSIDIINLQII